MKDKKLKKFINEFVSSEFAGHLPPSNVWKQDEAEELEYILNNADAVTRLMREVETVACFLQKDSMTDDVEFIKLCLSIMKWRPGKKIPRLKTK